MKWNVFNKFRAEEKTAKFFLTPARGERQKHLKQIGCIAVVA